MEKILKQLKGITDNVSERVRRLEKITIPLYTAGRILFAGSDGLPTSDSGFEYDTTNKRLHINSSGLSATINAGRGTGASGSAAFVGTNHISHFNYDTAEHTYIRGGKSTSRVIIGDANAGVDIKVEAWQSPTLLNGWVNYNTSSFNPAGYFKDSFGVVHLRGLIKDGSVTAGTVLFNLPAGYRPYRREVLPSLSYNSGSSTYLLTRIDVSTGGDVIFMAGSSSFLTLDGLTFRIA